MHVDEMVCSKRRFDDVDHADHADGKHTDGHEAACRPSLRQTIKPTAATGISELNHAGVRGLWPAGFALVWLSSLVADAALLASQRPTLRVPNAASHTPPSELKV